MFADIWLFIQDEGHRTVLTWVGSGIAAVVAGIWAVCRSIKEKKPKDKGSTIIVRADHGSIAGGHDVHIGSIDTSDKTKR